MSSQAVRAATALLLALALVAEAVPLAEAPGAPSVDLDFAPRWTATQPIGITNAADGTDRLFIVEQPGRIRVVVGGTMANTAFLDIASRTSSGGERGLLGLAFPPGFTTKQYFYVNYTDLAGHTRVSRFRVSAADPDIADPASEEIVLTIAQPFANHNGGQLAFGPDGFLYIGTGDGGSGGDPLGAGQDPGTLLGKILRIDTEGGQTPYGIPASNPFVGIAGARPEIWALGLRNPWRFSFDRGTGGIWIADVGQSSREEVNFEPPGSPGGRNYGWNRYEGSLPFPIGSAPTPTAGLTFPVFEYDHTLGRSITGGFVYRGPSQTGLTGLYLFADFITGRFWALDPADLSTQLVIDTAMMPASFGEDEAGELYVADRASGMIFRLYDASEPLNASFVRLSGADRYATAAAVALDAFPLGSDTAVLASGEDFPDALSASGLAGALDAPLLLTRRTVAPAALLAALGPAGLDVDSVVIVGGTAAVSAGVADDLAARGFTVTRTAGADRYATAAAVAIRVRELQGAQFEGRAFLVSGEDFPDGLAAAPYAYAGRGPILLTARSALPPSSATAIASLGLSEVVVAGGPQAVSDGVALSLGVPGTRVQGADRHATAAALAETAVSRGWTEFGFVGVATGATFADGLTGGAAAGVRSGVLLLTSPTTLPASTAGTIDAHAEEITAAAVFGGPAAVSDATLRAIRSLLR